MISLKDFEDLKENIIPLKGGRDLHKLSETKDQIEQERIIKLNKLSNLSPSDPLADYLDYINFINQHYETSHPTYLDVILDACHNLKNNKEYSNDSRYIRLWVRVANVQDDPIEVFKYLATRNIGLQSSYYYIPYAEILESRNKYY